MSEKDMQLFTFEQVNVRVIFKDDSPWWVAADVCEVLGLSNPSVAVAALDDDVRSKFNLGRQGETSIVSEAGLYSLILRSRKPEAKRFKRWITHDVLPAIRRTGRYGSESAEALMKDLTNPDNLLTLLNNWKHDRDRRIELEHQAQIDAPKVIFADAYRTSKDVIPMRTMAKILHQRGANMGQNRFFKYCVRCHLLMKTKSGYEPTQRAMEMGLFELVPSTLVLNGGEAKTKFTVKVTAKGQIYFVNRFRGEITSLFPEFEHEDREA
ncbi:MAG: phage antirepressor [Pyramidobacter sp.]|nr:phage antirepressor [Pyramidobacter sp.]